MRSVREVREEAGIDVRGDDLTPLYVYRKEGVFEYHNFLVTVQREFEPVLNWENAGFAWAELGDWAGPVTLRCPSSSR